MFFWGKRNSTYVKSHFQLENLQILKYVCEKKPRNYFLIFLHKTFFQAPLSESQRDFLINRDEMQNRLKRFRPSNELNINHSNFIFQRSSFEANLSHRIIFFWPNKVSLFQRQIDNISIWFFSFYWHGTIVSDFSCDKFSIKDVTWHATVLNNTGN